MNAASLTRCPQWFIIELTTRVADLPCARRRAALRPDGRAPGISQPGVSEAVKDVTMSDQTPAPGGSGDERTSEPEVMDEAREAAMMRAVMRAQEEHREGGVDPELDEATPTGPESDA